MTNELLDYFHSRDARRRRRWHTAAVVAVTAAISVTATHFYETATVVTVEPAR